MNECKVSPKKCNLYQGSLHRTFYIYIYIYNYNNISIQNLTETAVHMFPAKQIRDLEEAGWGSRAAGGKRMRKKVTADSGEGPQAEQTETSDALGANAVECLNELIGEIKDKNTQPDIIAHYYMIYGFLSCCLQCGFITEESADELMNMVKRMTDHKIGRIAGRNLLL